MDWTLVLIETFTGLLAFLCLHCIWKTSDGEFLHKRQK